MTFELWETRAGNRLAEFDSKAAALDLVYQTLQKRGQRAVETWLLAMEDDKGVTDTIADGEDLARLAKLSHV